METGNMSPQDTALHITEILECILLHLDQKSLLISAQRVCRSWHSLISQPPLQKHLFLQPDWDREQPTTSDLLVENFPLWFYNSPGRADRSAKSTHINTIDMWTSGSLFNALPLASPLRNEAFMYKDASWRRMMVQQPPIPKFAAFTIVSAMGGKSLSIPSVADKNRPDSDARSSPFCMGQFYDRFTMISGAIPSTFSIIWKGGEKDIPSSMDRYHFQEEEKEAMKWALEAYGMILVSQIVYQCTSPYMWTPGKKFVFDKLLYKWESGDASEDEDEDKESNMENDKEVDADERTGKGTELKRRFSGMMSVIGMRRK